MAAAFPTAATAIAGTAATMTPVSTSTLGPTLVRVTERLRASGSDTPRLDAEVLLAFVLGATRTAVLAHPDAPFSDDARERLERCVARREAGEPVAYIRGTKEFHGLALSVDARVLIPRPETELLVDLALARVAERLAVRQRPAGARAFRIADVGTGSGAVVIAVAADLRRRGCMDDVDLIATDVSRDALQVARANAMVHGLADRIEFREEDLLPSGMDEPPFDAVLANLPYVASASVAARFEPALSLDGGHDGMELFRRLLGCLPSALALGGFALLEVGADQGDRALEEAAARVPGTTLRLHRDLAGLPRVLDIDASRRLHDPPPASDLPSRVAGAPA
jgi:release factor glutamine methyltransferase